MDLNNLMQMAGQLKEQLNQAQADAGQARFAGEAGGGLVKVVVNGRHEVVEVKIAPTAVDPDDIKLLEDLIRAAVNQAVSNVSTAIQDRLGSMAQGLGVDLSSLQLDPDKK